MIWVTNPMDLKNRSHSFVRHQSYKCRAINFQKGKLKNINLQDSLFKEIKNTLFKLAFPKENIRLYKINNEFTSLQQKYTELEHNYNVLKMNMILFNLNIIN